MTTTASVQVPATEAERLEPLADAATVPISTAQALDGITMAQLLLPITAATAPVLIRWIEARVAARQQYRVFIDGAEFSGYTAREVQRLMTTVQREISEADNDR